MFHPLESLKKAAQKAQDKIENLELVAKLTERFSVAINQTIQVPIKAELTIPIKAEILLDTIIETRIEVPLDLTLDQNSMQLDALEVELDEMIHIKDSIMVNLNIPLDSKIKAYNLLQVPVEGTLPLQLEVPLDQAIAVKGRLRPAIKNFSIPLKKTVSLAVQVPIKQTIFIEATVKVQLDETLTVPLQQDLDIEPGANFRVTVKSLSWQKS
jgi:hypothetical protein